MATKEEAAATPEPSPITTVGFVTDGIKSNITICFPPRANVKNARIFSRIAFHCDYERIIKALNAFPEDPANQIFWADFLAVVKNIVFVFSPNVELHLEPIGSVRKALDGVEIDIGNCVMRDTSPAGAGFKWLIIGDSGARFEGIEELAYMIIDQGLPGNGGPV